MYRGINVRAAKSSVQNVGMPLVARTCVQVQLKQLEPPTRPQLQGCVLPLVLLVLCAALILLLQQLLLY